MGQEGRGRERGREGGREGGREEEGGGRKEEGGDDEGVEMKWVTGTHWSQCLIY